METVNSRMLLLLVAVISIGIFALPTTVSRFTGQHTFKNASEVASDSGCRKCHEDIYEEMHSATNQVHWNVPGPKGSNDVFQCTECHTVDFDISVYYQTNSKESVDGHAATTIACLSCHSELAGLGAGGFTCNSCHVGTAKMFDPKVAGSDQFPMHALAYKYGVVHNNEGRKNCSQCHRGANLNVFIEHIDSEITNEEETHRLFYYKSKYPDNQSAINLKDSNTACLGCHSHTRVTISWRRSIGYEMTVNATSRGMKVNLTGVSPITDTTGTSGS